MNIVKKIKEVLTRVLEFTTGLGFYGIGLLIAALFVWALLGWSHIAASLVGAFVFKNYKAIVDVFKGGEGNI